MRTQNSFGDTEPGRTVCCRLRVRGAVQGVGFRPFVFRLATELGLEGWVRNSPFGVLIEVQGSASAVDQFLHRLPNELPRVASIHGMEATYLDPADYESFEIRESESGGATIAVVLPDIGTCRDCLAEIRDPSNRRYRYPFTNCTNCGPRYSIIEALPYDRPRTTMKRFEMCPACQQEYEDPLDRRFHAQPNACPECGPALSLMDRQGLCFASGEEALMETVAAIRRGRIVAVKGLGGFHLMVDARNAGAVTALRDRKNREEKPLALMAPGIEAVQSLCEISRIEERLLVSPEAPIVILRKKDGPVLKLAKAVAPGNPTLGIMLPYTPLHHLLLDELGFPVVATSGNLSDEPICTTEEEALDRLGGIADIFLAHDRPIRRHVDDSIMRVMAGRGVVLRRARGFAPYPVGAGPDGKPVLCVGAHLKSAVAIRTSGQVFLSQHIGDLDTASSLGAFRKTIEDLGRLYEFQPKTVACDEHPDYASTRYAETAGKPVLKVQHHYAHVLSCMAENEVLPPALGIAWDGTGYGPDGTVWGGECLKVTEKGYSRFASFRRFPLPGGEKAVKEPRRTALGILFELMGESTAQRTDLRPLQAFTGEELKLLWAAMEKKINCPLTSSAGRLFDGVASLLGRKHFIRFEGQAAMELEFLASGTPVRRAYPFEIVPSARENETDPEFIFDWAPMIRNILRDIRVGVAESIISGQFHAALADGILAVACKAGLNRVVLSGGCFQNKQLTEQAIQRLQREGFRPYWHQRVPPNDGGIAAGQAFAAGGFVSCPPET